MERKKAPEPEELHVPTFAGVYLLAGTALAENRITHHWYIGESANVFERVAAHFSKIRLAWGRDEKMRDGAERFAGLPRVIILERIPAQAENEWAAKDYRVSREQAFLRAARDLKIPLLNRWYDDLRFQNHGDEARCLKKVRDFLRADPAEQMDRAA